MIKTGIFGNSITGQLVELVPVSLDWLQDFHEYSVQAELYEHLEFNAFCTIEDSRAYLKKLIFRSSTADAQYWFIKLPDNEKVVGTIGLHSFDQSRNSVEVGYGVSPEYWGQGIFKATLAMIINFAFNDLCVHRIVARTSANNTASICGLEKLGFIREGEMRDYYRDSDGHRFNALLYSKLSTDI
jgi:ribosomal-protein-alanine N-acetyltransferase